MDSRNKAARTAGFLYLAYIVLTIAVDAFGRSRLFVYGDAVTTARNIVSSEGLFRLTVTGDLVSALLFLLTAWALYVLLRPVNGRLAGLFLLLNFAGVVIQCVSDLAPFIALHVLSGPEYLTEFPAYLVQSQAMVFLYVYKNGFMIAQLFYGAWLFPLGYLIYKSGFLPKALGIVVMVHCVAWTATFFQYFLFPGFNRITYLSYPLGFISEFGLTLWLLVKGAKDGQPESVPE